MCVLLSCLLSCALASCSLPDRPLLSVQQQRELKEQIVEYMQTSTGMPMEITTTEMLESYYIAYVVSTDGSVAKRVEVDLSNPYGTYNFTITDLS